MTRTRVIAALIMAPAAICAILLLPSAWLAALSAIVFLTGLWEWLKLSGVADSLQRTVLLTLNVLLMVLLVWGDAGSLVLLQLTTLVGIGGWLLAAAWLRHYEFGAVPTPASRICKLVAGTLAIVPAWTALLVLHADPHNGPRWLLTALTIVWAADSGAYFAGKHWGRRKLAPRISPNKTWAGVGGGLVAGLLAALLFGWIAGVALPKVPALLLTAAVTVAASVLGDLFESLVKRHAGAKDSSHLIPGHGGVLDRVDGVLAALPVFAIVKEILGF